jgi:glycosyltransferase involved in cell wall biosynthesis
MKRIHPLHIVGNMLINPRGEVDNLRQRFRRYRALRMRTGDTMNRGDRKIFVFCPDNPKPVGGFKVLYRHVDVLNGLSIPATILHSSLGFRCSWFANTTRVTDTFTLTPSSNDIVVLPEAPYGNGQGLAEMFPGVPKVVFNQNCYFTFTGYDWDAVPAVGPYRHPEVLGAMTVSTDSLNYLEFAFPGLQVERIHVSVNSEVFYPGGQKRPRICFMPRKHPEDAAQVFQILRSRGALGGIEVVAIDGLPEHKVAEIMRTSLIFMSFGYPEGLSLPPIEAMACGCVVVGYHGMGGREYFDPSFCYPIEINDIIGFAAAVECALEQWRCDPASITRMGMTASRHVLGTFTAEQERSDIQLAWSKFLS